MTDRRLISLTEDRSDPRRRSTIERPRFVGAGWAARRRRMAAPPSPQPDLTGAHLVGCSCTPKIALRRTKAWAHLGELGATVGRVGEAPVVAVDKSSRWQRSGEHEDAQHGRKRGKLSGGASSAHQETRGDDGRAGGAPKQRINGGRRSSSGSAAGRMHAARLG